MLGVACIRLVGGRESRAGFLKKRELPPQESTASHASTRGCGPGDSGSHRRDRGPPRRPRPCALVSPFQAPGGVARVQSLEGTGGRRTRALGADTMLWGIPGGSASRFVSPMSPGTEAAASGWSLMSA